MRTSDPKKMIDIIYNPQTDLFELYSFGARIRRSPDVAPLDETAYYIQSAYSKGRDDILEILNSGSATLEELNATSVLMRTLSNSQDPAFEEDALFGQQKDYRDIADIIHENYDNTGF